MGLVILFLELELDDVDVLLRSWIPVLLKLINDSLLEEIGIPFYGSIRGRDLRDAEANIDLESRSEQEGFLPHERDISVVLDQDEDSFGAGRMNREVFEGLHVDEDFDALKVWD